MPTKEILKCRLVSSTWNTAARNILKHRKDQILNLPDKKIEKGKQLLEF
jgi:F-box associated protein